MNIQKFKRGNLVEILVGHIGYTNEGEKDFQPEDVGRKAIIEYSYAEKYGGNDTDSYSIIFEDTGSSMAWKRTNELRLIEEGGEHLFEEAKKKRAAISKRDTDINYILANLEEGSLSSESILLLFDLLGFESSFKRNGEFFALYSDWARLHPVFVHIKNANSLEEVQSVFNQAGLERLNVKEVYQLFHIQP